MKPEFKITAASGKFEPNSVPSHVKENIAQVAFSGIIQAWNTPEIREDYKRWRAEREAARVCR